MDAVKAEEDRWPRMNRIIAIIFVVVIGLGVAASKLYMTNEASSIRHSQVSSVMEEPVAADKIFSVSVKKDVGEPIIYIRKDGSWRLPQYSNAYAIGDMVDSLVKDITDARGVPVDRNGKSESWYGIGPESAVVALMDAGKKTMASVVLGRALPGMWDGDSYIKPSQGSVIYHIDSNPFPKLVSPDGLPSMIDRRVIPSSGGLEICGMRVQRVEGGDALIYDIGRTERELSEEEAASMPPAAREMTYYDWFAIIEDKKFPLDEKQMQSYIAFLVRMSYAGIVSEERASSINDNTATARMDITFCERGSGEEAHGGDFLKQVLQTFPSDEQGRIVVRYGGNPATMILPSEKERYIFPSLELLATSVETAPVYNSIQY